MYKIRVNDSKEYQVEIKAGQTFVNGEPFMADIKAFSDAQFHLIHNNRSVNVEVLNIDETRKKCTVRVGDTEYQTVLSDQFDELLHQLGMDNLNAHKVAELKAPMPGLVLKVLVSEGDSVLKGDNLLILEAMKMENIIKSPADLTIRSIRVNSGDKVEKNAVMLVFE